MCNGVKTLFDWNSSIIYDIHALNVVADNFLSNKPVLYAWCVVVVYGVW